MNEVYIGYQKCNITESSSTQISCILGKNSSLVPNVIHGVEVLIKNIGYAVHSKTLGVKFLPVVLSVSNNQGSLLGGNRIVIEGDGFVPELTAFTHGSSYFTINEARITYNSITFDSLPDHEGVYNFSVWVNNQQALCDEEECVYSFSTSSTPELYSISQNYVNQSNTVLTINGSNFGLTLSDVMIKIGNQECKIIEIDNTTISCKIDGLEIGEQSISLRNLSYYCFFYIIQIQINVYILFFLNKLELGYAQSYVTILGYGTINSIFPNAGSIYGGQLVTINGNGFTAQTSVSFGSSICQIVEYTISKIRCKTSEHGEGSTNLIIKYSFL